jgi:TolB-like protein
MAAIWGGRIVSESALTTRLNGARKAIGDSGEEQRLIKTLPRKGVRFVGDVCEERQPANTPAGNTPAPSASPVSQEQPSIVVLPFANLSGDPLQDYFTDGVVEDIITELSRFSELFVIARNTSFTYKGQAVDIRVVGRDLGVRYALEGSVRKVAKRVRITGQLIDAESGKHIWADRFESSLEDIFALQDQMAHSVVGAITPRLEQAEIERAKRKPTESLSAYDCFLRGMAGWHDWTRAGHDAALRQFYRAIELDPTFARPHALAAGCYLMRKSNGWVVDRAAETAETDRLARLGADLGRADAIALAWSAHALAHVVGDINAGIALIDHALRLNPNLAVAWQRSGWIRIYAGECEVAIEHLQTAMRLSPLDPLMHLAYSAMAFGYFLLGDLDQSSTWSDRALQMRPDWPAALRVSAMSNALAARERPAQQAMTRLRALQPTLRLSNLHEQMFLHRPEHMEKFIEAMRKAGLPE